MGDVPWNCDRTISYTGFVYMLNAAGKTYVYLVYMLV